MLQSRILKMVGKVEHKVMKNYPREKNHQDGSACVLVWFCQCNKHHDQRQVVEERTYRFGLQINCPSSREAKVGTKSETTEKCCSPACFQDTFLIYSKHTCIGWALPTVEWALPH